MNTHTSNDFKDDYGYLSMGKLPKGPSTGMVPQRLLLDTSLHNSNFP